MSQWLHVRSADNPDSSKQRTELFFKEKMHIFCKTMHRLMNRYKRWRKSINYA